MMHPPWLRWKPEDENWLRRALLLPLDAAALAVRLGAQLHRGSYERGWRRARRLPCRVISVGNLVVGGSGKTPAAAWFAAQLRERGHRVVLASRGYRGRRADPVTVVSDGRFVRVGPEVSGDEAQVLAAHAPGVPVLVGRDRGVVGLRAVSAFAAEVLVLDDGHQHHRLARDVEIAVFDGSAGFGNRRVLPRGPLREPMSALSGCHAIGVVDGPLSPNDEALLQRLAPDTLRFRAQRRPARLRPLSGRLATSAAALATLKGAQVGALASIAQPSSFRRTLEALGAEVVAEQSFRDHHHYRPSHLGRLRKQANVWITTEKDAVSIQPTWLRGLDLRVLEIDFEVEHPEELLDCVEQGLKPADSSP